MSIYRRNVTDTKFKGKYDDLDVLVPTADHVLKYAVTSSRYERGEGLYTDTREINLEDGVSDDEEGGLGAAAWHFFERYLRQSTPVKFAAWASLREQGDTAGSFLSRRGVPVESFSSFFDGPCSMPGEALEAMITVQAKLVRELPPCRLCDDCDYENHGATNEEVKRHNLHMVDEILSVAPYKNGDEQNLFLGQEGQITTTKRLRDVLIERTYRTESIKVCVAQVNIYSKEESNTTATVSKSGRIVIEGAGNDAEGSNNASPLSALLPWIRLPSFLLPTKDGKVEIQEINFWGSPEECQTNTHYDGHHNLLLVLHGSKNVELSPPGAIRGSPVHGNHANHPFLLRCTHTGGNLHHRDFAQDTGLYCSERHAMSMNKNIVVEVPAGDAVFIPEGWWHRVESSDDCIAINVWFNYKDSSLSSIVHNNNQHQLPYQAREMVRRYIDANIEDLNESRQVTFFAELLGQVGFDPFNRKSRNGWIKEPGQPIRKLFRVMTMGRLVPKERTDEEILGGMTIIERYASQLLGVSDIEDGGSSQAVVRPLRLMLLPHAIDYLGSMISLFLCLLDPKKQRDRIAMMSLFGRFPPSASLHQRQIFTALVKSITREACYILSVAWEKHGSPAEAESSYSFLFGQCVADEGRKHFTREVDEFRNESARRLILGDLMLLNPNPFDERS